MRMESSKKSLKTRFMGEKKGKRESCSETTERKIILKWKEWKIDQETNET